METHKLKIKIVSSNDDTLPKQLQILDAKLTVITSTWLREDYYECDLEPGYYLVQLILASGKQFEKAVEVKETGDNSIEIEVVKKSPAVFISYATSEEAEFSTMTEAAGDSPESAIPSYTNSGSYSKSFWQSPMPIVTGRLWSVEDSKWSSVPVPEIMQEQIDEEGKTFTIEIPQGLHLLEIENPNKPSTFVRVPPHDYIKCHIKLADGQNDINEIDVAITISDDRVQTLLTLLNSGDTNRAKSFIEPVDYAERLLYQKVQNPMAAAIGGYYLLKTGELERLHGWARNLANWFDWLPDGAVIYSWQLIQESKNRQNYDEIKTFLLNALKRGVPIFTEGLRLLHDGLSMYSYHAERKDKEIEKALLAIKQYVASADMSCEMTTYTGIRPDSPGEEPKQSKKKEIAMVAPRAMSR